MCMLIPCGCSILTVWSFVSMLMRSSHGFLSHTDPSMLRLSLPHTMSTGHFSMPVWKASFFLWAGQPRVKVEIKSLSWLIRIQTALAGLCNVFTDVKKALSQLRFLKKKENPFQEDVFHRQTGKIKCPINTHNVLFNNSQHPANSANTGALSTILSFVSCAE